MTLQALGGLPVQLDHPHAGRSLGLAPGHLVLPAAPLASARGTLDQLAPDDEPPGDRVQVVPPQRQRFAPPHAGEGENLEEDTHSVRLSGRQEGTQLLGVPGIGAASRAPWQLDVARRIGGNQAGADSRGQPRSQGRDAPVDGRGAFTGRHHCSDHRRDGRSLEVAQFDVAEMSS